MYDNLGYSVVVRDLGCGFDRVKAASLLYCGASIKAKQFTTVLWKKIFDTFLRSYVAYEDRKIVYCVEKMFACL